MSGAASFGLALVSGNKAVFALAVFSHLSHWWSLSHVEGYICSTSTPHLSSILTLLLPYRENYYMNEQPAHEALVW